MVQFAYVNGGKEYSAHRDKFLIEKPKSLEFSWAEAGRNRFDFSPDLKTV